VLRNSLYCNWLRRRNENVGVDHTGGQPVGVEGEKRDVFSKNNKQKLVGPLTGPTSWTP
jgi:hypothetical protein